MTKRVGLILVHGIGEQGRFEHLDGHVRGIIQGLRRMGADVTVEIVGGTASSFQATQDAWRAGPHASLRLVVRGGDGPDTDIHVHEVWWADVNERYSLMKQVRFWLWGLSVWAYPEAPRADLPTGSSVFPPRSDGQAKALRVRVMLFALSCFFLVSSLTIGIATVLLKRLLGLGTPDIVKIFANYLSSIKLYNQRHRAGTGLSGSDADFLDAIGDPPRTSVRRRMIRTIADVAMRRYDRWYIYAHSQGAVVAFNGLMEPAFGWPGYLDEGRWKRLRAHGLAGPAVVPPPPGMDKAVPGWPVWVPAGDIVYRSRIFARFGGLLTYGCPLEKFAAIWPARVPVCREAAFGTDVRWINVYDPLDPVSGIMRSWPTNDPTFCPAPTTVGYASSSLLLWGHLTYLQCPIWPKGAGKVSASQMVLADGAARWLLTDDPSGLVATSTPHVFQPGSPRARRRQIWAWTQWLVAFTGLSALGAILWPWIVASVSRSADAAARSGSPGEAATSWSLSMASFGLSLAKLILVSGLVTLAVGAVSALLNRRKPVPRPPPVPFSGVPSPEPGSQAVRLATDGPIPVRI